MNLISRALTPHAPSNSHKSKPLNPKSLKASYVKSLAKQTLKLPQTAFTETRKQIKAKYGAFDGKLRNLARALKAAGTEDKEIDRLLKSVNSNPVTIPFEYSFQVASAQGKRPSMEDAHFILQTDDALVFGVCDGHGDDGEIAKLCAQRLKNEFLDELENANGDVSIAAQKLIDSIQQQVLKNRMMGGSTIAFCYLNKKTNVVITITLGDSEVRLYYKTEFGIQCIPLSLVLDWSSPKEAKRAAVALKIPEVAKLWPQVPKEQSKLLRAPPFLGPNLSRAIGDQDFQQWLENPSTKLIIQKCKVTQFKLPENLTDNDIYIVAACDGVWDVEENLLPKEVLNPFWGKRVNLAEKIVHFALKTHNSTDNVSVVVMRATAKPEKVVMAAPAA